MKQIVAINDTTLKLFKALFKKVGQVKSLNNHTVTIPKICTILRLEAYPPARNYNIYCLYRQKVDQRYCDTNIDLLQSKRNGAIYPVGLWDHIKGKRYVFWNKIGRDIIFCEIEAQPALAKFVDTMFSCMKPFIEEMKL